MLHTTPASSPRGAGNDQSRSATVSDRMKYPKECKLERMAAGDPDFEWMNKPILDVGLEKVVAVTSWGMAVVPVQVDKDETTGFVPLEAIRAAGKGLKRTDPHIEIECKDHARVGSTIHRRSQSDMPLIPNWQLALTAKLDRPTYTIRVAINVEYLKRIADAMGCGCLEMTMRAEIAGPNAGTVLDRIDLQPHHSEVYPAACLEAMGCIMPRRI